MKELNLKHEAKRYGCAVLAATIMALNIKTFVRAGGLFPGGFTGLTLLLQNIFQTFMGIAVPYTLINVLLNSIPVFIGLKFIGKKFTISSVCVIVLSGLLTDIIPSQPITYDTLLISIFGGLINGFYCDLFFREKWQGYLELYSVWKCSDPDCGRFTFWMGQGTLLYYLSVYLYSGDSDAASEI